MHASVAHPQGTPNSTWHCMMTNNVVHGYSCRYTDAGTHNCCGEPGSLGYEGIDMATFASWGECHAWLTHVFTDRQRHLAQSEPVDVLLVMTHVLTDRQRHLAQVNLLMCCW
jgi:hypothetical protein